MSKIDKDVLHKEIDLIQSCINRMAHNSFLIKGWTITLIAVVLALAEKMPNPVPLCLIMLVPLISFWWLDTFFLRTEKMYREMYMWVLKNRAEGNDEMLYDLNPLRFEGKVDSRGKIMRSKTLGWFYGIPVLIILAVLTFNLCTNPVPEKIEPQTKAAIEKCMDVKDTIKLECSKHPQGDVNGNIQDQRSKKPRSQRNTTAKDGGNGAR